MLLGYTTSFLAGIGVILFSFVLFKMYSSIPEITSALISINLGIYVMVSLNSNLIEADGRVLFAFGSSGVYLLHGKYYTLVTSMFLHANLLHIGLNMYALYVLGKAVEFSLGRLKYLTMYFVSGVVGNLLSAFLDPIVVGVGASGAIMGLLGYMVAMEYKVTGKLSSSTVFLAIFVIFGGFSANVDVLAHLGGFIVGLVWGLGRRFEPAYKVGYDLYY